MKPEIKHPSRKEEPIVDADPYSCETMFPVQLNRLPAEDAALLHA